MSSKKIKTKRGQPSKNNNNLINNTKTVQLKNGEYLNIESNFIEKESTLKKVSPKKNKMKYTISTDRSKYSYDYAAQSAASALNIANDIFHIRRNK
jgi:hypothetical protein